ncbi:hypothetical protein D8M04_12045 [Oceanobacillus piezotolerans]|uniref:Uncharacterized protein n=1 Tax=Oceanobacillus piezotolerans TaxID=2448030 RepID=A0A498DKZ0_9BACI|nr:hypothetical protein D8M04_12045 [Oceanobacillus piezotolerans]
MGKDIKMRNAITHPSNKRPDVFDTEFSEEIIDAYERELVERSRNANHSLNSINSNPTFRNG